jgi:ABC-type Zn uptake system ZnuABC Zn-binding protein ZnuA
MRLYLNKNNLRNESRNLRFRYKQNLKADLSLIATEFNTKKDSINLHYLIVSHDDIYFFNKYSKKFPCMSIYNPSSYEEGKRQYTAAIKFIEKCAYKK